MNTVAAAHESRLAHMRRLFGLWRNEVQDPRPFYEAMAIDAVADLQRWTGDLAGQQIADLGCGPGFYTEAFRAAGAVVTPVDNAEDELTYAGDAPEGYVLADAGALPFGDGTFDGVYCSNLLEHTPNTPDVLSEIARVLRPGGWGYVSWTNWYSPWGGHDMSPYHFLGPQRGPALYERRHGPPRKNRYGEGLWAVHIGPTLRLVRADARVQVVRVEPRYWPSLRVVCAVPGLREFVTWNCVIGLRRV